MMTQYSLADFFDGKFSIVIPGKESKLLIETLTPECPICDQKVKSSNYLHDIFIADRANYFTYYMAVFITHYRHNHQKSWDRLHSNYAYQKTVPKYDYYQKKAEYNNRAKRQLIRAIVKSNHYSLEIKIQLIAATDHLKHNDEKTKELMNKSILKLLGEN